MASQINALENRQVIGDSEMTLCLTNGVLRHHQDTFYHILNTLGRQQGLTFRDAKAQMLSDAHRARERRLANATAPSHALLANKETCRNFARGRCQNGDSCPRRHDNSSVKCYSCGHHGHVQRNCRKKQNRNAEHAHLAQNASEVIEYVLSARHSLPAACICPGCQHHRLNPSSVQFALRALPNSSKGTILDSGATSHVFSSLAFFDVNTLRPSSVKIYLAEQGRYVRATHRGDALVRVYHSSGSGILRLRNALLVPHIPLNLVSLSCLDTLGCRSVSERGQIRVKRHNALMLIAYLSPDRLYHVSAAPLEHAQNPGGPHWQAVKRILWCSKFMRSIALRFHKSVTVDLCATRHMHHFVVIKDTTTNYTFVYFLSNKNDFMKVLRAWLAYVKDQMDRKPTLIATGGTTDFTLLFHN